MKSTRILAAVFVCLCMFPAQLVAENDGDVPVALSPAVPDVPPDDWEAWSVWADARFLVGDAHGHGPDIGSDEWAGALDLLLSIRDAAGHGPAIKSKEWRQIVEKRLGWTPAQAGEKRQLLSSHATFATFSGLTNHRCRGLTALCPDQCGESGQLATFKITKYLRYQKFGEYGDPEQQEFQILIEDNHKNPKVPAFIRDRILALKPGDRVRLQWTHDYLNRGGSRFPERPIVGLMVSPNPE